MCQACAETCVNYPPRQDTERNAGTEWKIVEDLAPFVSDPSAFFRFWDYTSDVGWLVTFRDGAATVCDEEEPEEEEPDGANEG